MELEQRVEMLEREIVVLKQDIRERLLDVQRCLSEEPINPSRQRKRTWVLALLNVLLAVTLFTNIHLYAPNASPGADSLWESWLRALWVAIACVWLIFQIYPLALLVERKNKPIHKVAWRSAAALLLSSPGLIAALTALVLVTAVISMLLPSLWFVIVIAVLVIACANIVWRLRYLEQTLKN